MHEIPTKPLVRPEFDAPQRTAWLPLALVAVLGLVCLAVVALVIVLLLGFAGPILVLALLVFLVFGGFGLQYLVWGRLFERIYRDAGVDADDVDRL